MERGQLTTDPAVRAFADAAIRYCSWAESPPQDGHGEMLFLQKILAELHHAVLLLPEAEGNDDFEGDPLTAEEWKIVFSRFQSLPVDEYWDVFDPLNEKEALFNSLADDLSDIYRDIKGGLYFQEKGNTAEAIWQWRFSFQTHWGAHLTGAQRAVYAYFA